MASKKNFYKKTFFKTENIPAFPENFSLLLFFTAEIFGKSRFPTAHLKRIGIRRARKEASPTRYFTPQVQKNKKKLLVPKLKSD